MTTKLKINLKLQVTIVTTTSQLRNVQSAKTNQATKNYISEYQEVAASCCTDAQTLYAHPPDTSPSQKKNVTRRWRARQFHLAVI